MKLSSIEIINFRNYKQSKVFFGDKKNYIFGKNAQGKSNLLEAIYLLCLSKSFRTSREKEAISFTEQSFILKGDMKLDHGIDKKLALVCSRNKGKEISENRKKINKISDFIGNFPIVVSSPEEYNLTTGSPPDRRKFINILLSQLNKKYIHSLIEYHRILKQKNTILLNWRLKGKTYSGELEPWNDRLIEIGSIIIEFRNTFLNQLSDIIRNIYSKLVEENEQLEFKYRPNIEFDSYEEIEDCFKKKLQQVHNNELKRGSSLAGPHRDDFIFMINGKELKKYGSRGQHKTVLISLAAAEYKLIKELTKETPIILIDDLYSELDNDRENKILNMLDSFGQVFITSTESFNRLSKNEFDKYFFVEDGSIQSLSF